jgi:hypothetical protein
MYAVELEYSLTKFWGEKECGFSTSLVQIPNGFEYSKYLAKYASVLNLLMPIIRLAWIIIGMPFFTIVWALRWIFSTGWRESLELPETVYLYSSTDRHLSYVPASVSRPSVALILPFRKSIPGSWVDNCIDLRSVTTRYDILRASILSIKATLHLFFSNQSNQVLFSYSALNWFWVNEAFKNSATQSVWISNHYDRWTALVTTLPNINVTIVQHGQLAKTDYSTEKRILYTLNAPLSNVERVFVLDKQSINDFKLAVTGSDPDFELISPNLRVVPWDRDFLQQIRLLVIGCPLAQRALSSLIPELLSAFHDRIVIAYRPHPREKLPINLPYGKQVQIIPADETIPDADIVLDYGSSLTEEVVLATGATVFIWIPADFKSIRTVVGNMKKHYDNFYA